MKTRFFHVTKKENGIILHYLADFQSPMILFAIERL